MNLGGRLATQKRELEITLRKPTSYPQLIGYTRNAIDMTRLERRIRWNRALAKRIESELGGLRLDRGNRDEYLLVHSLHKLYSSAPYSTLPQPSPARKRKKLV